MWRTGVHRQNRRSALAEMVRAAGRANDYNKPWSRSAQIFDVFADESDVLRELQKQWWTALAGAVYLAIETGHGDLREDVLGALEKVRAKHRDARAILEAHADHPAIAGAMRKEGALLSPFTTPLSCRAGREPKVWSL